MANKNGRWAYPLTMAILALVIMESASAHLPSLSPQNAISDGAGPPAALDSSSDYGMSLLDGSNSFVKNFNAMPTEGGVYISGSLAKEKIGKFLAQIASFPGFGRVFQSEKKIMITDTSEKMAEGFVSLKSGKSYFLNFVPVKTAMDADGYFAELGDFGVISLGNEKGNDQLFTVLLHEMTHAIQFDSNDTGGAIYNFAATDVRTFPTQKLYDSLRWVEDEIQAHFNTAEYINEMLSLPQKTRSIVFQNLGLTEDGMRSQMNSEATKYLWYETEETKILDELVKRKQISG